ncbi:MAG: hypothetical protein R2880_09350 [Deinococcales bacterium]
MMNYAALLALLAALAFTFPFLVRLAEQVNIPRSYSIVVTLAVTLFLALYIFVRDRVIWRQKLEEQIGFMEKRLEPTPQYHHYLDERQGEFDHLGDLYLALGDKPKALAAFKAYLALDPPAASHHQHITHAQEQIEKLSTNLERETAKETS